MLVGGHVSIAGGLDKAISRAEAQGFEVIQTFASSPRSFSVTNYTNEQITAFNQAMKASKIVKQLFFHAIYLINLASQKPYLLDLSIKSLVSYLNFGAKVNCSGTIFHVGSSKDLEFKDVKEQVVAAIKQVLAQTPKSQFLIMESAAGAGNVIGDSLEELTWLYNQVDSSRLKVCLDTQHLWASGVNVADKEIFGKWLKQFDQQIGIANLICLHVNDSKSPLGSNLDRHENIGMGLIGKTGFKNILNQPLLKNKPLILEVPGIKGEGPDKENRELLLKFC